MPPTEVKYEKKVKSPLLCGQHCNVYCVVFLYCVANCVMCGHLYCVLLLRGFFMDRTLYHIDKQRITPERRIRIKLG